ncbi:hypothetical protein KPL71_017500 [Citrus sinensis]|uniref:Uncharacterized protein n=1 Tax=Citrus sinensis TaxID=2711 RepID=A0ACB8JRH1_CITSI|nr:hypothetical protein KPL71_017500 [Citrus sinensis]
MDIPTDLVTNWKRERSTHLHLGGVKLILTLHGKKGLPVTTRIGLLHTRFKQYQHAVIGTILTTLHAGSVLLTFYPNFNMSLEDPNLPTILKVQIQLQGAEQTSTSKIATLHHQIVRRRRRKKKSLIPKTPCRPYSSGPPDDPELDQPLPFYKKVLKQIEKESSSKPVPTQPKIKSCLMFSSSTQSYQESFLPLERHTDPQTKVLSQPYVQSPITTLGQPEAPKQYEAVLNSQTQNPSTQNQALHHLGKKIDKVASQIQLQKKVHPPPTNLVHLNNLLDSESQYADISGLLMVTKAEDPITSTPIVEESSDDNNDDQASQTKPVPPVPPVYENSSKPSSSPWFTFDDISRHKWQARHQEFAVWIDVQMTIPHAQTQNVLREFCSRFTRSLRDWFESLGEYRQLQLIQTTIATALVVIYEQFIREPAASTEASRKEYHQMKCCSLKRHHLEMHYKRMSMLY